MTTSDFQALQETVHREHEERQQALLAQLDARAARAPRSAKAWQDLGVVQLESALSWTGPSLLPPAQASLERALAIAPQDPALHGWLGRCLDVQDRPAEALEAFRRALELAPDDSTFQSAIATLSGKGRPAVHFRNFIDSRMRQARDRIEKRLTGRSLEQLMAQELAETQAALKKSVARSRVPAALRSLTPWAQRLGIGDDGLRGLAVQQLPAEERATWLAAMASSDAAIDAWVGAGDAGEEAAAFRLLQLAAEEARQESS